MDVPSTLAECEGMTSQKDRVTRYWELVDVCVDGRDDAGLLEILEHLMKEDVPQVISRQARGGPSRATADPLPSLPLATRRPLYPDPRDPRDRRAKQKRARDFKRGCLLYTSPSPRD